MKYDIYESGGLETVIALLGDEGECLTTTSFETLNLTKEKIEQAALKLAVDYQAWKVKQMGEQTLVEKSRTYFTTLKQEISSPQEITDKAIEDFKTAQIINDPLINDQLANP